MTQDTAFGATQLAEPPALVLPGADEASASDGDRRKLMLAGAVIGVIVVAIVAFFLLKGGGGSGAADGFTVPHHVVKKPVAAAPAPVVKLPKRVVTPVGRDPFKALYVAPAAAAAGAASGSTSSTAASSSTATSGSATTTGGAGTTTTTPTYHPVSLQLRSISGTEAVFAVGYSNGKTLRTVKYTVKAPKPGSRTTFATSFALLSIHNGVATLQFGDGSPFQVDRTHNTMVVG